MAIRRANFDLGLGHRRHKVVLLDAHCHHLLLVIGQRDIERLLLFHEDDLLVFEQALTLRQLPHFVVDRLEVAARR